MGTNPEAVMRRWFDELWNQGCEACIDEVFAADGVAHGLPGGPLSGPDAFRPVFKSFRGAFPDIHVELVRTLTEGDTVVCHCLVTGNHTGDSLGFAATGNGVEFSGMVIARVRDGQIVEGWNCFDFLTMYQQLGVVPHNPGQ